MAEARERIDALLNELVSLGACYETATAKESDELNREVQETKDELYAILALPPSAPVVDAEARARDVLTDPVAEGRLCVLCGRGRANDDPGEIAHSKIECFLLIDRIAAALARAGRA